MRCQSIARTKASSCRHCGGEDNSMRLEIETKERMRLCAVS